MARAPRGISYKQGRELARPTRHNPVVCHVSASILIPALSSAMFFFSPRFPALFPLPYLFSLPPSSRQSQVVTLTRSQVSEERWPRLEVYSAVRA